MYLMHSISETYPRAFSYNSKLAQKYNDQQTLTDDAFQRMAGYQYFGIIDHDEFFIPAQHKTLPEMLVSTVVFQKEASKICGVGIA